MLSPTLFSIYINDVPLEKSLLFADDIIYIQHYNFRKRGKILVDAEMNPKKRVKNT